MTAGPTRRVMLTASAALPLIAVAGCKGVGALAAPPSPAPDVGVLKAAIAGEELMIARYEAVLAGGGPARPRPHGGPGSVAGRASRASGSAPVQPRLSPPAPRARRRPGRRTGRAGRSCPPSLRPPSPSCGPLSSTRRDVLLSHLGTVPPSLAQLLASISASEATHAAILRPGGLARMSASADRSASASLSASAAGAGTRAAAQP